MNSKHENTYDVAVVGLGVLGSSAAYHIAKKGAKVIAFEQFELGHVKGASHDTSRIVRTSYEAPEYVALAKSAYRDWADLEAEARQKLLTITGGAIFLPKSDGPGKPASDPFDNSIPTAMEWAKGLEANNLSYELLNNKEANQRWPGLGLKDDMEVIYTPDTGIVHAYKTITAMQFLARMHGANMLDRVKVEHIAPAASKNAKMTISTSQGTFRASKVVLAADAWINELLRPFDVQIPVQISQEQVTYFKPSNPDLFTPDKFPVWVWVGPQWFYGFPCYGEPTIKAGHDNAQQYMLPSERTFVHSQDKVKELNEALDEFIPDGGRQELRTVTCQYTRTPNRQFVVAPLENHDDVVVLLGSAHGFKFAPAIGRIAAELVIDGETKDDISKFKAETIAVPLTSRARL